MSVHPAIAAVARWVNDTVRDSTRQTLWPLVMASLGTGRTHPPVRSWRMYTAAVAARRRAIRAGNPVQAWEEILEHYRCLVGVADGAHPGERATLAARGAAR